MDVGLSFIAALRKTAVRRRRECLVCVLSARQVVGGRGRQGVGLSDGDRQRESVFP